MGAALPVVSALHAKPTPAQVEQRLLDQMNAGPDGTITRSVHCLRVAGRSFSCDLRSIRSTSLGARVVVDGGSLQMVWQPLRG